MRRGSAHEHPPRDRSRSRSAAARLSDRGPIPSGALLMITPAWIEIGLYLMVLLLAVKPLGLFMARVLEGERTWLTPVFGWLERLCYRVARVNPAEDMDWKRYAVAMLFFNMAGLFVVYALQRLQQWLPLNPQHLGPVTADSSFNTAVSFA